MLMQIEGGRKRHVGVPLTAGAASRRPAALATYFPHSDLRVSPLVVPTGEGG